MKMTNRVAVNRVGTALAALCGAAIIGCSDYQEINEQTDVSADPINTVSCATATRDAVVNSTSSQIIGVYTPNTYDNPGCNEGYIVEFDGTVNGVHYGYRLEEPRAGSTDGINVLVAAPVQKQFVDCASAARAGGYLYEKVSGSWVLRQTVFHDSYTIFAPGLEVCNLDQIVFDQVHKGSATTPHIYRVAVTMDILDASVFIGSFPDGVGYGSLTIKACDGGHTC